MMRLTAASGLSPAAPPTADGCLAAPQVDPFASIPMQYPWVIAGISVVAAVLYRFRLYRAAATSLATQVRVDALQKNYDDAAKRIDDFGTSQERFVSHLAQEIRAPLATVLLQADHLSTTSGDAADVQRYSRSMAECLRHLSDLVDSILRLARPFADNDTSQHVPVHIHDVVLDAVRRCQSLADTRGVRVVPVLAEARSDVAVEVLGDALLLETMIENMVRNSVLSAPADTCVDLHVSTQPDLVVLSVRAHGLTVDEANPDALFEDYFKIAAPARPAGAGLSLAMARRVAEHHRGKVSLRNVPEGGCEFAVQLPRWRPGASENGAAVMMPPSAGL